MDIHVEPISVPGAGSNSNRPSPPEPPMPLLDPDDRRDLDVHLRLSQREYLIVLKAVKARDSSSFAAGVREMLIEHASQAQITQTGADDVPR